VVLLVLLTTGCGSGRGPSTGEPVATSSSELKGVTLKSITVGPTPTTLFAGGTESLTATGNYSDGSTQDLTDTATWTSSDVNVATVSATGGVTAIDHGSATITAQSGTVKGKSTVKVSVTLTSIAVTPGSTTLPANATQALEATAFYDNGSTKNLTSTVTWTSSDTTIATVTSAGLVVTVAPGTATISATTSASSDGAVTGTATIVVDSATISSVAVTPAKKTIPAGTSQQLKATATYSDGTKLVLEPPVVSWSSADTSIATVSAAGLATGVTPGGPVAITATSPGSTVTGAAQLTVSDAKLVSIAVTPAGASIGLDYVQQFTATGTYTDQSTMDLTAEVIWASSAPAVATISNVAGSNGLETGVGAGVTTISATDPTTTIAGSTQLTVFVPLYLQYFAAPFLPPGLGGGLDIYGGQTGNGSEGWDPSNPGAFQYDPAWDMPGTTITLAQAEAILGPSVTVDDVYYGVNNQSWGANSEIDALTNPTTGAITDLILCSACGPNPGAYTGTMTFQSADGTTVYTLTMNEPIQSSTTGAVLFDWNTTDTGGPEPDMVDTANELYDALLATFAPGVEPDGDCTSTTYASTGLAECTLGNNQGAGGYLYFPRFNLALFVTDPTLTDPYDSSAIIVLDMSNPAAQ
jgi:uncharacterized protein YjdB